MVTTFRPIDSLVTMPKLTPKKEAPAQKDRPMSSTRDKLFIHPPIRLLATLPWYSYYPQDHLMVS